MPAPKEILDLVERFGEHLDAYRNGTYKEAQLRQEFLDPFFRALGWDMDNIQGFAEAYKEVIHEDTVKIGDNTKAPDYSFRIGGTRKYFVEAKKPSVYIKGEPAPAFQLRRYAWSAKLPLSILTDFEEFAVYDCRIKPSKDDPAASARIYYWTFRDYADKWDEIAAIFSKDALHKGSFDKFAATVKGKRGTAEVDSAFLDEIETWRETLAKNIALRNPDLSQPALNYAVQQTIDRVIFLRIAEDRGIEPYGQLQALANGANVYQRLTELFHKADERYNSGLFHFREEKDNSEAPDKLTLKLDIDDKPLKEIFQNFYYPDSPYEFSVIGADILGSVYERFLGKVIRLTAGHHAKIEEKPEVKKAGGVYYTPTYIVDYIVKHTVGKLLEGKTPKEVEKLRILDPACGSGSFLIGAYQYLLDWHRDWYEKDGAEKHTKGKQPKLYQGKGGMYRLTTSERKRILTHNIHGVDIDSQAVEVTKLSLLLKVLEGESDRTLQTQLFHERVLPDLGRNIKCGNSLIGPDFYETDLFGQLSDEEMSRVNAFDWGKEFSAIIKAGGFDAVLGNPPYLYSAGQEHKSYFSTHFSLAEYQTDFYVYFVEKGLQLLREHGYLGMIVSDSWIKGKYFRQVREHLLANTSLQTVVVFGYAPFAGAAIENSMFITSKGRRLPTFEVWKFHDPQRLSKVNELTAEQCLERGLIDVHWTQDDERIIGKLEAGSEPLSNFCLLNRGVHQYRTDGYGKSKFGSGPQTKRDKDEQVYHSTSKVDSTYFPELKGKHLHRYGYNWDGTFISYGDWLAEPRTSEFFMQPKLAIRKITAPKLVCTYISEPTVLDQSLYIAISKQDSAVSMKLALGILASWVGGWYLQHKHSIYDTLYPWFTKEQLATFPIPKLSIMQLTDTTSRIVALVEKMLSLNKQLSATKTPHEQENLKRQIDATDRQIDKLVYELYGLTDEEIKIVEGE